MMKLPEVIAQNRLSVANAQTMSFTGTTQLYHQNFWTKPGIQGDFAGSPLYPA
jgi:hypothetical protein